MTDEVNFLKEEIAKKGYPLENYIQGLLRKDWDIQPNAYFLDKDTDKGREIDIKANHDGPSAGETSLVLNLLIQCKKLPGNAWIFFSVPRDSYLYFPISKYGFAEFLKQPALNFFSTKGTHFEKSKVMASNYCEIITDRKKSNGKDTNIWECMITLVKATSQEMEDAWNDTKQYLEDDLGSYSEFAESPFELIQIFYPVIVFEGKMYEAKFASEEIILEEREYISVFIDYKSGRYKGRFCVDVVKKEGFSNYLKEVLDDLQVFAKKRVEASEYEKILLREIREYFNRLESDRQES